jgi:putative transposase
MMKVIKQTDFSNEKKADWIKVFNDLIDRGQKRVMLIVSDDFLGISKAIETLFPYVVQTKSYV